MLVGEAPGVEEERTGLPFVGASGNELDRMLHEAGLNRAECFVSNVSRMRPPGNDISEWMYRGKKAPPEGFVQWRGIWVNPAIAVGDALLKKEIAAVKPEVIVAFGNVAMYALTGKYGITDWRGSQLTGESGITTIPTFHPAAVLRQWSWRAAVLADLKRAAKGSTKPEWFFTVRPSYAQASTKLALLLSDLAHGPKILSFDIETRHGHIACAAVAWSEVEALCIPFMESGHPDGYWPESEEIALIDALRRVLTHSNARVVGQNLLYDAQYTLRWWHFAPRVWQDTMISHHTAFCELPKALDFQASLYCKHYIFWKNDGKEWSRKMDESVLWSYNCEDAVRTYEVAKETAATIKRLALEAPHASQQAMFWPVLQAMSRGVRVDEKARADMAAQLMEAQADRERWLYEVIGHPINPRSPKQMQALFYDDLKQKVVLNRKTGRPSLDDEALQKIVAREPLLESVVGCISDIRTIGVLLGTFVGSKLGYDGRLRCSFNICGAYTFRLSSSEDAFGSGMDLQNIPSDKSKSVDKARRRGSNFVFPNVRKMFIPDEGFTFFEIDLERADLYTVVWESEDAELKSMLRSGADIHTENAKLLNIHREIAKVWVHGTNYGGSPRTMAVHCGLTVHAAEQMRARWFGAHPGILKWHTATQEQLLKRRFIENRFGYRWYVFDRPDGLLSEALAWVPQSQTGLVINKIWLALYGNEPQIQVLLQVHDSLVGQFPTHLKDKCLDAIKRHAQISIPYSDPLIIPTSMKVSEKSWGDCA